MPEFDEFGIPIKNSSSVDEFGIPIKKKVPTVLNGTDVKTDGSSGSPVKDPQKPLVSSGQKSDGVFKYPGREQALYKKVNGKWTVSPKGDGNFVPLKTNVEQRTKELDAKAKQVFNTGYDDEGFSFQQSPEKAPIVSESIGPSQDVFQEDFYVLPKENMTRDEQIDFVATKKAKEELGENATPEVFKERKQYYANVSTQKNLKNDGYDVDVNGNLNDPKTKKALFQYNAKEALKQKSSVLTKSFEKDIDDIVTSDLIGNSEEQVVQLLNKRFAKDGFTFEESGLGDAMTVKYSADNGLTEAESITIDLDTFFSDQGQAAQLKQYMKSKYIPEYEKTIALGTNLEQLQKEGADQETIDKAKRKYTEDLLSLMGDNPKKFGPEFINEDVFNNLITDTYRDIRDKKESLSLNYGDLNKEIEAYNQNPTEEKFAELTVKKNAIDKMKSELFVDLNKVNKMEEDYKKALGHYTEMKGKEGNFLGAIGGSFLKGFTSAPKALANIGTDVLPQMMPYGGTNSYEYEQLKRDGLDDAEIKNKISSELKRSIIADADKALVKMGSLGSTTQEYVESEDRGLLENAINGLAESVGTSFSGGGNKMMQALAFFSQSYNNMEKEMSAPEFDDMSLWEKKAISVGYGLVMGQLEKLGFNTSAGISKNPLVKKVINNTLLGTLKEVPKDASVHVIEEAISNNLKATLISSGIKIVSGALAEGGTEATQTLAEVGIKNIVNAIHEKDYFSNVPDITTPEGLKEALGQAMEDGLMGAIGGAVMSSYDSFRNNRDEKQADSRFTEMYESLNDPAMFNSVKMNVGLKYKNGQITKDEARSELNNINQTKATLDKIPTEYSIREKRAAYNLLTEKESLQTKIAGKDPLLVNNETDRIKTIDEELKSLKPNTDEASISKEPIPESKQSDSRKDLPEQGALKNDKDVAENSEIQESITLTTPSGDEVSISPEGISVINLSEEADVKSLIKDALFEAKQNGIESVAPLDNQGVYEELASEGLVTKNEDGTFTINETTPESEILTEKTNLGRVYDFLDSIDKSLGEYTAPGKLNDITGVLPAKVLQVVVKALKVSVEAGMTLEQAIKDYASKNKMDEKQITNSLFSISDAKERELRYKVTSVKQSAPKKTEPAKAAKEISKKNVRKIVVDEVSALKDQIRLEAKAALEKKKQVKDVISSITRHIRETKAKGNVSIRKMNSVINRLNKVNMDSQKSIDQFIEYIDKTLMDSEYAMKIDTAMSNRKRLRRLIKDARNEGKFIAKAFSQLNPNWVEDIDKYNEVSETLYNSIKKSHLTAQRGVSFKSEEGFGPIKKYIAKEQELQSAIAEENLRTLFDKAYGENESEGKTIPEMRSQMSVKEPKNNEPILQELEDKIASLSEFVDEDAPDVVKRAVEIDVRKIDTKLALQIIDAIDSYVANGRASGINKIMAKYQGIVNSEKSTLGPRKSTRLFGSKALAKANNLYLTNVNIVLERVFKGVKAASEFVKESGWGNLVNHSNKAETEVKTIQNEYLNKFKKVKGFNKIDNIIERGTVAFLSRTSINGDEFETRKKLLLDSVGALKKGDDSEKKKAGHYEKVFKKLDLESATSIEDVILKSEKSNVEAVQFITEMWQDKYDQLSDHAFGFHDIILSQDLNYNPDKYSKLSKDESVQDDTNLDQLAMMQFTNMVFDKSEAGVLMENTKPKALPKGRYVDLDFDSNTFRAFEIALVDLYTAEDVSQLDAYMKSDKIEDIISSEDLKIIRNAMLDYQLSKRHKIRIDEQQLKFANNLISVLSRLGVARSLAGIGQIPTQWTTAQMNTMINTGIHYSPGLFIPTEKNKAIIKFIQGSGRAIANRGLESVSTIERADDLMSGNSFDKNKVFEFLKKANDKALRLTLSNPDVSAAYDGWWSYYKKSMAKQKLPVSLDEINDQAADYAQSMIDRNMDVSDTDLRGKLYRSKGISARLFKQIWLPFSTFSTNQKNRLWSDISTFMSGTASTEDKWTSIRSIGGLAAEAAIFNAVRYQIAVYMFSMALEYLGVPDEEKEEYLSKFEKDQKVNGFANAINDVISPSPIMNDWLLAAINDGMDLTGTLEGDRKEFDKLIAEENEKLFFEDGKQLTEKQIENRWEDYKKENGYRFYVQPERSSFGVLGTEFGKISDFKDMLKTSITGEYTTEYEGRVSNKIMAEEGREAIKIPVYMKGFSLLFPPREVDQFATKVYSIAKKKYGMSETQYEKLKELKKRGFEVSEVEMPLIKSKLHLETIAENLSMMSGLSDEDKKSYIATLIK